MARTTFGASLFVLGATLLPSAMAHIGIFHPSVYGFHGPDSKIHEPLHSMPISRWLFHGEAHNPPPDGARMQLPAGGNVTIEVACEKRHTSFGGGDTSHNHPCPSDPPAMHSGPDFPDHLLRGCAIAIAYKQSAADVRPEDFTVISVNHYCVRTLRTVFEIPAGLPPCPNGKCVCGWFWQGQVSNDEMYMNGFDCSVENPGDRVLAKPVPPKECREGMGVECVRGAKQPMYWANEGANVEYHGPERKPAYLDYWGFPDGAQNDIFEPEQEPPAPDPIGEAPMQPAPAPPLEQDPEGPIGAFGRRFRN
ncbi:hypothetical protein BDZ91DRAFT_677604 [Kalaharituber pfeilii]|nr:hypothetical protein BDZ91DRAFT_677604 [Kalaharituber pfeilii]